MTNHLEMELQYNECCIPPFLPAMSLSPLSSLPCPSHLSAEKQLLSAGRVCARCSEVVRSDVSPVTLRGAVAVGA